jgi:hypothetical protein
MSDGTVGGHRRGVTKDESFGNPFRMSRSNVSMSRSPPFVLDYTRAGFRSAPAHCPCEGGRIPG